jgi:hypothetical protein
MGDLLDNFLDLINQFLAVASDFMKSLFRRMGGGKERKMNGRLATRRSGERWGKRLKQKLFQTESAIQNILSKKLSA